MMYTKKLSLFFISAFVFLSMGDACGMEDLGGKVRILEGALRDADTTAQTVRGELTTFQRELQQSKQTLQTLLANAQLQRQEVNKAAANVLTNAAELRAEFRGIHQQALDDHKRDLGQEIDHKLDELNRKEQELDQEFERRKQELLNNQEEEQRRALELEREKQRVHREEMEANLQAELAAKNRLADLEAENIYKGAKAKAMGEQEARYAAELKAIQENPEIYKFQQQAQEEAKLLAEDGHKDFVFARNEQAHKHEMAFDDNNTNNKIKLENEQAKNQQVLQNQKFTHILTILRKVGKSIQDFVTDKTKMGSVIGFGAASYGTYRGMHFAADEFERNFRKPNIIEQTNGLTIPEQIKSIFGMGKYVKPLHVNDVILDKETKERATEISRTIQNVAANGGYFRNYLFWGAPGTGKTFLAQAIAHEADAIYMYMSGASLFKLEKQEALAEIDRLFNYARSQSKPVLLLIDEAEVLFGQRNTGMSEEKSEVITHFLSFTGAKNNKFAMVAITNYPEQFDEAMLSRFPVRVQFKLPGVDEREKIIWNHFCAIDRANQEVPSDQEVAFAADLTGLGYRKLKAKAKEIALKTKGLTGRDLMFMSVAMCDAVYESKQNILTEAIIDKCVYNALLDNQQAQGGFQRAKQTCEVSGQSDSVMAAAAA
ncbi:MAG: AAA family ATPase [Epsilonproteobacteria bacterium]|nr:AAA family ATPase [Campylobacterota bacterium]